jgi:sigma-54 dependent transcriptional regulator, acetoin dehydrogenase operon transcriptional activator AcoR
MNKKIGLLFSLSGTISIVGEGQLQAALLAIDEVNNTTDLIFEPLIRDAKSDPRKAAREAYSLFNDSQIDALVGCYMSSERNSLIPVLNESGGLLLYPTLYEGEQVHPNIFYLGAVPNQQVEPLLSWAIENLSSNFVLVGSDYIYPRSTNRQVRQWVENAGGNICNETYFPLGCTEFDSFFQELRSLCNMWPSLTVFSTIVGTSAVSFYKEYRRNKMPFTIISPITSEREIHSMGKDRK